MCYKKKNENFACILLVVAACIFFSCANSNDLVVAATDRVILNKKDTIYQFYVKKPSAKFKIREGSSYYWYSQDTILITREGYSGKLLNGSYKVFYPAKNIKEDGMFVYGLKEGKWKNWFNNGNLESEVQWHNGKKNGEFIEYNAAGIKIRSGTNKDNVWTGIISELSGDGKEKETRYENGTPVTDTLTNDPKKRKVNEKKE